MYAVNLLQVLCSLAYRCIRSDTYFSEFKLLVPGFSFGESQNLNISFCYNIAFIGHNHLTSLPDVANLCSQ